MRGGVAALHGRRLGAAGAMITIEVRADAAQRGLKAIEEQMPFALSLACNRAASAIQKAVRANVEARFVLRERNYTLKQIAVLRLADKKQGNILGDPRNAEVAVPGLAPGEIGAAVGLHPNPVGSGRRTEAILERFETGRPKTGGVAIPTTTLRPNFADRVPRQFYPGNLGLEPRRLISGGFGPSTNRFGSFVLGNPGEKRYGIYARVPLGGAWGDRYVMSGKRKGALRKLRPGAVKATRLVKLWHLKDSVPIPARLGFYAAAHSVLTDFQKFMIDALQYALRTARSTGLTPSNRWSHDTEQLSSLEISAPLD